MFDELYKKLNDAQRRAVDTTDGPVLVVAGPGTGKTQLLSMRVANILRTADVTPRNILCMTFTEEAADNMRRRLASIIGQDAYDVEIHTFHSFGANVITRFGEYFFQGIGSRPIDELGAYEIYHNIFRELPHDNPLSLQYEGDYFYLRGAQAAIDNFKTAGLSSDEVRDIAQQNLDFTAQLNAVVADAMDGFARVDKTTLARFQKIADAIAAPRGTTVSEVLPAFVKPLSEIFESTLTAAIELAEQTGKTTSLTQFKNTFLVKNAANQWQLKDNDASKKLLALADVYQQYSLALRDQNYIDFNDMITRVVHAVELSAELRLNLQEQYQYILVDEFQDTSLAQLRLLRALTDNPVFEGRPNILAVGDDDQAIYSFQGAELNNILNFHQFYRDVEVITLTDNYRSRQAVLDAATFVISPSSERLVQHMPGITKDITAKNTSLPEAHIAHHRFASADTQREWIATQIADCLKRGTPASDIAVIAPKHRSLRGIVPFLQAQNIPVQYDKRENILDVPAIIQLLTMAKLVVALSREDHTTANALLPEILSYDFWGLSTTEIWQLYLQNYRKRSPWIELARQSTDAHITNVANFFIELSRQAHTTACETMVDYLLGLTPFTLPSAEGEQLSFEPTTFTSPFAKYYFTDELEAFLQHSSHTAAAKGEITFLEMLSHLTFLRDRLREHTDAQNSTIGDLLAYTDLLARANIQLVDTTPHRERTEAVQLFTAHASKGLEFGTVFIIDANHDIWMNSSDARGKISMPSNVQVERRSGSEDERRRLLYVAMTRAKHTLYITGFEAHKRGNAPLKYLLGTGEQPAGLVANLHDATAQTSNELTEQLLTSWHDRHIAARVEPNLRAMLQPTLSNYRLSITHLQHFLNVADGGPNEWFMRYLLRFPQPVTPHMALGIAVHNTLDAAHKFLQQNGTQRPLEELLQDFETSLQRCRLSPADERHELARGRAMLTQYLTERYKDFKPAERFEYDLGSKRLNLGDVQVTGKVDRITPVGDREVCVVDFKTGKPMFAWETSDQHKAIAMYHYKQQLAFYRLLLEESDAFGPGTKVVDTALEYIHPDASGQLAPLLHYTPSDDDIKRLQRLAQAAWKRMCSLDFPDTSHYEKSLKGIQQFEEDLLSEE